MKGKRTILVGTMVLSLIFASGTMAFAADTTGSTQGKPPCMAGMQKGFFHGGNGENLETAIENLVSSSVLTEDEAEEILATFDSMSEENTSKGPFCDLTEEQISALMEKTESLFAAALDELVEDEVLTEEEADAISEGTPGQKKSLSLTEEEQEAVCEAREEAMEEAVAELLEAGTLSDEEAEAILTKPEKEDTTTEKTEKETPLAALTETQRQALMEELRSLFEEEKGTLNQEETARERPENMPAPPRTNRMRGSAGSGMGPH